MLIRIGRDHAPHLEEPDNFRGFKLVIEAERAALPQLKAGFAPAGRLESEEIAWVTEAWLRAQSPQRDDPSWQDGFRKMMDYARTKGWIDPQDGSIRAHVEWVS